MLSTTVGQLMINETLPPELRDYSRVLDKAQIKELFQQVADKYPDKYREISKNLSDVGRDAAFTTGGYSFGLNSLRQSLAARTMRQNLNKELEAVYATDMPEDQKEQAIIKTVSKYQKTLADDVMAESIKEQNPLALQAVSGARGNKINVNSLRGADLLYTDHRGRALPIPVTRSYSMGLKPHEYFAGAFGARKGIIDLKAATQDAGFFAKQLVQAAHRLLVSQTDSDDPYDELNPRGFPVETDDPDNEGALLAHPVGGYQRNTVLTPKMLKELKAAGIKNILVRSPNVGGPSDGGVYARDIGIRDRGGLSPVGDYAGIAAAQALAEPVTQAQICLAEGTLVRMADWTVKAIELIEPGEWILGADKEGKTFPVQVLQRFNNGLRMCYKTTFRQVFLRNKKQNFEVVSTLDHKFLGGTQFPTVKEGGPVVTLRMLRMGEPGERVAALAPCGFIDDAFDGCTIKENLLDKYADARIIPKDINSWDNKSIATFLSKLYAKTGHAVKTYDVSWAIHFLLPSKKSLTALRSILSLRFGIYAAGAFLHVVEKEEKLYALCIGSTGAKSKFVAAIPVHGIQQQNIADLQEEYPTAAGQPPTRFKRHEQELVGELNTFDLEVAHPDHLFVLANGLIVSNSSKHSGGVAGAGAGAISGFKHLNQLVQVPKTFQGGAAHAQLDGKVQSIEEAPQGGNFVTISGKKHYVGQGFPLRIKQGDEIEAGDVLSDGTPNPAEIVKHKGIGEGRRYFVKAFKDSLTDSGTYGNRRNIELLARGLINHVRLTDEVGDWSPEDVVPYQLLESQWKPRPGNLVVPLSQSKGYYLEKPVLHYSVGTRMQPSIMKQLKEYGVPNVSVHPDAPPFEPEMIRGMANAAHDPDWMTKMLGSYQKGSLLSSVHRGAVSDEAGTSYVPALSRGIDFGQVGPTKGWKQPQ